MVACQPQVIRAGVSGVNLELPEMIERLRPGLQETGRDAEGKPIRMGYTGAWSNAYGPVRFTWCSPAYKPFRDHLFAQIKPLVDAGVYAVHFDEVHPPLGKFVVGGVTAIEGVMQLHREVRDACSDCNYADADGVPRKSILVRRVQVADDAAQQ